LLIPDRHRLLLEQLRATGSGEVGELAVRLGVSPSTVRRDLAELEAEGRLKRTQGGAYLDDREPGRPSGDGHGNASANADAKLRIGAAASALIGDGATVMILAGSTTAAMLPHLADRSITVVTNGLDIAHALAAHPGISLVMLGGVLHREQMTLLGAMTEQNMADFQVDLMFAGAYGVDPRAGVTGSKPIAASYHHSMLEHTEKLVVLADSSKLGRRGPTRLATVDQVDRLITDAAAPATLIERLRGAGAHVEVC
jgi:DeoR/GlpR family transcriptional regulator of sugar metabolism